MAMAAYLYAVSEAQIEELRRDPDAVGRLRGGSDSTVVCLHDSINYFLTGSAYPEPGEHRLAPMLHGMESIDCTSLENGNFGIVTPNVAEQLARDLAKVDLNDVRSRVDEADLDELVEEEELYDLETVDHVEASNEIVQEIRQLTAFYTRVAEAKLGVAMHTA